MGVLLNLIFLFFKGFLEIYDFYGNVDSQCSCVTDQRGYKHSCKEHLKSEPRNYLYGVCIEEKSGYKKTDDTVFVN